MFSKTKFSEGDFSEKGFWSKIKKHAKKIGKKTLKPALKLYYAAMDSDTPAWAKTTIFTALAYFIFPVDSVPDILPMAGYTDDLGLLTTATATVAAHIKEEHSKRAEETLKQWFE